MAAEDESPTSVGAAPGSDDCLDDSRSSTAEAGAQVDRLEFLALNWPPPEERPPPAFQEYAARSLASEDLARMNNAEFGIYQRARLAIWCTGTIPADSEGVALALRVRSLEDAWTPRVREYFPACQSQPDRLYNRELAAYMLELLDKRVERTNSGRKGGNTTARNNQRRNPRPKHHRGDSEFRRR